MKRETARANKKQYILRNTKEKLKELDGKRTTPKKKNLVKKLKTILKWNLRKTHAPKRKKGSTEKKVESDDK
jgi:hypothetical protein